MPSTLFLRLTQEPDKALALEAALTNERHPLRFSADVQSFRLVQGSPFSYWIQENLRQKFKDIPPFEQLNRVARVGAQSSENERYMRCWWEPSQINTKLDWRPYQKGGKYSPYYSDVNLCVDWDDQRKTFRGFYGRIGRNSERPSNFEYYFRPGLTWPARTTSSMSMRPLPCGCAFDNKGPSIFVDYNNFEELLSILAITNSQSFLGFVRVQLAAADAAARSYDVGIIQRTPVPPINKTNQAFLAERAKGIWGLKQKRDQAEETSHVFLLPALLISDGAMLLERAAAWDNQLQTDEAKIQGLQDEIDVKCWDLYEIAQADRQTLIDPGLVASESKEDGEPQTDDSEEESSVSVTSETLAEDLASWLFGSAIGRWDAGLATDKTPIPPLPGPFDKLPPVSRGMLIGADGLHPAKDAAGRFVPEHDLLVDDEGHDLDLLPRMLQVLSKVAGPQADDWLQELEALLGTDLRTWIRRTYFERHLKRHSKSRRKAPLHWQLGTSSGSYSVWLYYPRLTKDSLYRVLHEVVKPKVGQEEQRLIQLRLAQARRSEVEAQETLVEELRAFQDEVARVTPLFDPDLDDGVLLNFAPLWRLTPHNGWRKDTKAAWEALVKGDYDWAHLALKLWPERVIPKCAKERHLALAHDLEGPLKTASVEKLIEAHLRPAVKEALAQLQAAPALGSGSRAPKTSRTAAAPRATKTAGIAPLSAGNVLAAVLEVLAEHPQGAARTEVLEATGLDAASWNVTIAQLLTSGQVRREGEKRGTRYFRIERS